MTVNISKAIVETDDLNHVVTSIKATVKVFSWRQYRVLQFSENRVVYITVRLQNNVSFSQFLSPLYPGTFVLTLKRPGQCGGQYRHQAVGRGEHVYQQCQPHHEVMFCNTFQSVYKNPGLIIRVPWHCYVKTNLRLSSSPLRGRLQLHDKFGATSSQG